MRRDDARPVWVQLAEEFRANIASGTWAAGSRIPSVRDLAMSAGANPNTIQRALAELDRDGLTSPERTAGRFVTTDEAAISSARIRLAADAAEAYVSTVRDLGLDADAATRLVNEHWAPTPHEEDHR